jgi:hypothetical protein
MMHLAHCCTTSATAVDQRSSKAFVVARGSSGEPQLWHLDLDVAVSIATLQSQSA